MRNNREGSIMDELYEYIEDWLDDVFWYLLEF